MRNDLIENGARKKVTAILNLDNKNHSGTHWTCFIKTDNRTDYIDSFNNLKPPKKLVKYLDEVA